eukprot:UN31869
MKNPNRQRQAAERNKIVSRQNHMDNTYKAERMQMNNMPTQNYQMPMWGGTANNNGNNNNNNGYPHSQILQQQQLQQQANNNHINVHNTTGMESSYPDWNGQYNTNSPQQQHQTNTGTTQSLINQYDYSPQVPAGQNGSTITDYQNVSPFLQDYYGTQTGYDQYYPQTATALSTTSASTSTLNLSAQPFQPSPRNNNNVQNPQQNNNYSTIKSNNFNNELNNNNNYIKTNSNNSSFTTASLSAPVFTPQTPSSQFSTPLSQKSSQFSTPLSQKSSQFSTPLSQTSTVKSELGFLSPSSIVMNQYKTDNNENEENLDDNADVVTDNTHIRSFTTPIPDSNAAIAQNDDIKKKLQYLNSHNPKTPDNKVKKKTKMGSTYHHNSGGGTHHSSHSSHHRGERRERRDRDSRDHR